MNIAFLHAGFSNTGGIQRVVSIILNALSKDSNYNLFSIEYIKSENKDVKIDERVHRFSLYDYDISMTKAILCGKVIGKTRKILKDNHIDVIIACGVLYFPVAVLAGKLSGVKSICWEHTNPKVANDCKFQKQARHFGLRYSSANLLITESAKKFYDSVKRKKNIRIYNPVDNQLFENPCSYDVESKKIISVGRLCYAKNFELLIELAEKVLSKHTDWSWDIYGDGEEYEKLKNRILNTSVSDRLTLKGNASNIYDLYPKYSFLVMTSRFEGFPMVLLEGAAKSLPLVSFDIETGPNEIIDDGVNGYLIKHGDHDTMVERINSLISNPETRKKMSENVQITAKQFSVEEICEEWKLLLKELQVC